MRTYFLSLGVKGLRIYLGGARFFCDFLFVQAHVSLSTEYSRCVTCRPPQSYGHVVHIQNALSPVFLPEYQIASFGFQGSAVARYLRPSALQLLSPVDSHLASFVHLQHIHSHVEAAMFSHFAVHSCSDHCWLNAIIMSITISSNLIGR